LQRREAQIKDKVTAQDSTKAQQVFAGREMQYQALQNKLQHPLDNPLKAYLPRMDSMQTALNFIQQKGIGLPTAQLQQIQALSGQLQQLQGTIQNANDAQQFIQQREQELKGQLSNYGIGKQLLGMNKEAYYYQQQLAKYKATINDPQKLQQAILSAVRQLPAFQSFWQRNSMIAQLFPMPQGYGTTAVLNGLQTNAQVQAQAAQQLGASAATSVGNPTQYLQQQLDQAQASLAKLKDKVSNLGGTTGSGDMTMPDFQPNVQKTRTFLKRLEYGINVENEPGTALLPTTSDIALTLGYKLSGDLTAGIGSSYKLGMGNGWNDIHFSSQGVGLRSYVDVKAKGSIWVTGGIEENYYQAFSKLSDLNNASAWQKSALIGLTKKYKMGKSNGSIQLLYDLLAAQQIPRTQVLKFRVGYSF
jgi:TolA-binding protein